MNSYFLKKMIIYMFDDFFLIIPDITSTNVIQGRSSDSIIIIKLITKSRK